MFKHKFQAKVYLPYMENKNIKNTKKKLYRSQKDCIIAGIASGLGEYFEVDPVLIRILFVFLALINGLGIIFYFILIFVMPKEHLKEAPQTENTLKKSIEKTKGEVGTIISGIKRKSQCWFTDTRKIIGISIVLVGLIVLFNRIYPIHWFKWDIFWPIALVFTGIYLLFKKDKSPHL